MNRFSNRFIVLPALVLAAFLDPPSHYAQIVEVDLAGKAGFRVNGAGPLLVKADPERDRVFLVNTFTSSVTVVDGRTHQVSSIPVRDRVPQFLKGSAVAVDRNTGRLYVIGSRSLHIVTPDPPGSVTFDTEKQFEMVAVNDRTGEAWLAGRESRSLLRVEPAGGRIRTIACFDREEAVVNLNATPPPSIRKVVYDAVLDRMAVIDGYTSTLSVFDAETGKRLVRRSLPLERGARWHYAGVDPASHSLFVAVETAERKVVEAAGIGIRDAKDTVIPLPGLTEGAGVVYDPVRQAVLIPYDNHPVVHFVSFRDSTVQPIGLPSYGNDASALDSERGLLYIASWAFGEIDVVDLEARSLRHRHRDAGVLPHMFSMCLNPRTQRLYVPLGATAVNGSLGAALTVFHLPEFREEKIRTGWSPVEIIRVPDQEHFLIFNSEDGFAEVHPDGGTVFGRLPVLYPRSALPWDRGNVLLTYGPHQSSWPTVYIWAARNGVLEIEPGKMETGAPEKWNYQTFDRRIPRLSHGMARDNSGTLHLLQNNWGEENLFLSVFPEGVRLFGPQERLVVYEKVLRETTQRILEYDAGKNWLYAVRTGETNEAPGRLLVINAADRLPVASLETGVTPSDLAFDDRCIYVAAFDGGSVDRFDKNRFSRETLPAGRGPLRMAMAGGKLYVINHMDNSLQCLSEPHETLSIPAGGRPDNLFASGSTLVTVSHSPEAMSVTGFDAKNGTFHPVLESSYPFGDTSYDQDNTAFFMRGQFGDAIFDITRIREDDQGRLWIADFLSGKVFIVDREAWKK